MTPLHFRKRESRSSKRENLPRVPPPQPTHSPASPERHTTCARHTPGCSLGASPPNPRFAKTASAPADRAFPAPRAPRWHRAAQAPCRLPSCAAPISPFARARSDAFRTAPTPAFVNRCTNQIDHPVQKPCGGDTACGPRLANATRSCPGNFPSLRLSASAWPRPRASQRLPCNSALRRSSGPVLLLSVAQFSSNQLLELIFPAWYSVEDLPVKLPEIPAVRGTPHQATACWPGHATSRRLPPRSPAPPGRRSPRSSWCPFFLNRSLETGASCPLSVVQYLVVRGNLPASLRRRAANYQRIKTRVCRLSCARVWYCCGHLSSANVLPWPHGGC